MYTQAKTDHRKSSSLNKETWRETAWESEQVRKLGVEVTQGVGERRWIFNSSSKMTE